MDIAPPFWTTIPLDAMNDEQWESLCDGCGKCCLIRLEDEDTGDIYLTDVACKLFDGATCRCMDYPNRKAKVPDCVKVTPEAARELSWLPKTCAYRLLAEGKPLFDWHPLISGDPETVKTAGMSVCDQTISELKVKVRNLPRRIRAWPGEA